MAQINLWRNEEISLTMQPDEFNKDQSKEHTPNIFRNINKDLYFVSSWRFIRRNQYRKGRQSHCKEGCIFSLRNQNLYQPSLFFSFFNSAKIDSHDNGHMIKAKRL